MVDYLSCVPKEIFMIGYMRDIQDYGNGATKDSIRKMFDRYDVILSPSKEYFEMLYPEYVEKMVVFPDFISPKERYSNLPVESKFNKCLLSGAYNPAVYLIRDYIIKNGDGNKIVHVPPPYFGEHQFIGDNYAKLLNMFYCCVTESGIIPYVVTKCFEIAASGSLLLTNIVSDMDTFGFIPNIHYIPITKENVLDTIYEVLDNPDRYFMIKGEAKNMILSNHTVDNRIEQLAGIIAENVR
jgi:hypothetical protein